MNAFLIVEWWLSLIGTITIFVYLLIDVYPRSVERTVAFDVTRLLINIAFLVWISYLRWT